MTAGVLDRFVAFGLGSAQSLRLGHFDYLKEDMDDEYKKVYPHEELSASRWLKTVTLADKLAAQEQMLSDKRDRRYAKTNTPYVPQSPFTSVSHLGCLVP